MEYGQETKRRTRNGLENVLATKALSSHFLVLRKDFFFFLPFLIMSFLPITKLKPSFAQAKFLLHAQLCLKPTEMTLYPRAQPYGYCARLDDD